MVPRRSAVGNDLTIGSRVDAKRQAMSSAMLKIADLLDRHPFAPVELTITELAERAGTSAATVTRFCRTIGFSGYTQFRVRVASEIGRGDTNESWRADIGRQFHPDDEAPTVVRTLLAEHSRALEATAATLDAAALVRVARAISACRHLDVYGVAGSGIMARELQERLYRIGVDVHSWADVHSGLASAVLQTSDSVAIGISNTGRTEETRQMLSQAASSGAFTVALTHDPASPIASLADVTLVTAGPGPYLQPDDLSAKHSQLMVIDLIYLITAQQDFAETATRLAASAMAVSGHRHPMRSARPITDTQEERAS